MKAIKLFFISVVVLGVVIVLLSSLLPSHVRVSRAIDIAASQEVIAAHISDLSKWKQWNTFVSDSMIQNAAFSPTQINSADLNVQLVSANSDSVMTLWRKTDRNIKGGFQLIPSGKVTIVQWYFDFDLKWYPWEKFASIIFDRQLGPYMESSLANLKKQAEH
jgi:hypothetical protein